MIEADSTQKRHAYIFPHIYEKDKNFRLPLGHGGAQQVQMNLDPLVRYIAVLQEFLVPVGRTKVAFAAFFQELVERTHKLEETHRLTVDARARLTV